MGKLLWLASYPKSGNTWLRMFLLTLLRDPDEPLSINDVAKMTVTDIRRTDFERLSGKTFDDLTWEEIAALRPKLHQEMTTLHPNPVMVKTHSVLADHFGTPLITPDATAGAIYVVRNPLDIAASLASHMGFTVEGASTFMCREAALLSDSERFIRVPLRSWSTHVKSWTVRPHPSLLVLRYEDMVGAPEQTFGQVARFLNLQRSPEQIRKAIEFTSFDRLKAEEQESGFRESSKLGDSFFRKGKVGTWREELTQEQAQRIARYNAEQMRRFGYDPSVVEQQASQA